MKPKPLLRLALLAALSLRLHAAEPSPAAEPKVGDLGRLEAIVYEGNQTYGADRIRRALQFDLAFQRAVDPASPLPELTTILQERVRQGYQHGGFPEVAVTSAVEPGLIRLRINEGPRLKCGGIRVPGLAAPAGEQLRQKLLAALAGDAASTNSPAPGWTWASGQPAPLDETTRAAIQNQVGEVLAGLDYLQPKFEVKVVPGLARGTADLEVRMLDAGIHGVLADLEVRGASNVTRPELLRYLELTPGREITAALVAEVTNRLWNSARFIRHGVTLVPQAEPGKFNLQLDLQELPGAPPLDQPFPPAERALLKFREWICHPEDWKDDLDLRVRRRAGAEVVELEVVARRSGLALLLSSATNRRRPTLRYAVVGDPENSGIYSAWRQRKYVAPGLPVALLAYLEVTASEPPSPTLFNLALGAGFLSSADSPPGFILRIGAPPVSIIHSAQAAGARFEMDRDGTLLIKDTGPEPAKDQVVRIDARTGRLIEMSYHRKDRDEEVEFTLRPVAKRYARALKEIRAVTARHTNDHAAGRGGLSLAAHVAADFVESRLQQSAVLEQTLESAFGQNAAEVRAGLDIAQDGLKLVQDLLAGQAAGEALAGVLTPLSDFFSSPDATGEGADAFVVPAGPAGPPGSLPVTLDAVAMWAAGTADSLWLHGSWPWTVMRESALVAADGTRQVGRQAERLYLSPETGPLACVVISGLLQQRHAGAARRFAELGVNRLKPEDFRPDWRLLTDPRSAMGRTGGRLLELFKSPPNVPPSLLPGRISLAQAAFFADAIQLLRSPGDQPAGEAVWPAIVRHWDPVVRPWLESRLQPALHPSQFLTDRDALFLQAVALRNAEPGAADLDEAAACLRRAAELGHGDAQRHYGLALLNGTGTRQNLPEALVWLRRAAATNVPHATCELGRCYFEGNGVPEDLDEAARWFRAGAETDCPAAQYYLALIAEKRNQTEDSLRWLRRAAGNGNIEAQHLLGDRLSDGFTTTADFPEACFWLLVAAEQGHEAAKTQLGSVRVHLTPAELAEAARRAEAFKKGLNWQKAGAP